MRFDHPDDILHITSLWQGERFTNGRPKVPEDILLRFRSITTEEAWGVLWNHGYKYQFQGDWKVIHPDQTLVGRAVTCMMVPKRPDLDTTLLEYGHKEEGRKGFFNSWVIETLVEDDVLVVDLFDKIYEGTFVGGNLSTAVSRRTLRGGQVIWGGIRDVQQVMGITNIQTFYRGNDPTGIRDVTLTGFNSPVRIGNATCLPGDVVLGTPAGIVFVPPHLAEECCIKAEKTNMRDRFGLQRLREGIYTTAQIDTAWSGDIWADFHNWRLDNTPPEYAHLDWTGEEEEMRKRQAGQDTIV
jgi:regulator of RNase E activity RraA